MGDTSGREARRGDSTFSALCDAVEAQAADLGVPGVAIGVVHRGVERTAGFGVTSVENPLPVAADTLFQIGSITKTFVGTAVMRLVERGTLDLDVPVRTYLPDLQLADEETSRRVTLTHLLTHTAGWVGDYFDDFGPGDDALATMVGTMRELPQLTPVGEVWSYNNAGFYLAGRVLEVVAGCTFEEAIRGLVLEPLGMDRTCLFPQEVISYRYVAGHHIDDDGVRVARPWALGRASSPAGGIISTVVDLLKYARFHLGDGTTPGGERLLSGDAMTTLQTAHAPAGGSLDASGITWGLRTVGGVRVVGHGGGMKGQVSNLTLVPSRGFALVVLTNANRGGEVIAAASRRAFAAYLDLADEESEAVPVPEESLREYCGAYHAAMDDLEIVMREGSLVLLDTPLGGFPTPNTPPGPASPPAPLVFYATDRVYVPEGRNEGARGEFLRDSRGRITWFRFGGRIHRRRA